MAVDNVHLFRKMQATLKELKSTQAQLIQSAKMAALGTISAGIAHEINNPLAIIRGYLEFIEFLPRSLEAPAENRWRAAIGKINKNIDRIAKIVRNVKDFSHQSERRLSILRVQSLIHSSLAQVEQPLSLGQIKVRTSFLERDLFVLGDFGRLEQVLVNILTNAKDAIDAKPERNGGTIHIHVEGCDRVRIEIADDGIGVSEDLNERVFDPFFTTKAVGQGTGLGLSISHGIVKDHYGSIEFRSDEKTGTKVVIELPMAQPPGMISHRMSPWAHG
jgi:histidine kinase